MIGPLASGRHHDRATLLLSIPLGLAAASAWGTVAGSMAAAAFLVGGLWLSPDLDTHSNALQRWGPLGGIWWPYRRLIAHRSIWSHGPLIGTTTRLLLLLSWVLLASCFIPPLTPGLVMTTLQENIQRQPHPTAALLLGLEASVWLHLIQDGDPWPAEWTRRRRR